MATPEQELKVFFDQVRMVGYNGSKTDFEKLLDPHVVLFRINQNKQILGREAVLIGKKKVADFVVDELRADDPHFTPDPNQQVVRVLRNVGQVTGVADWQDNDGDMDNGTILYDFMFS